MDPARIAAAIERVRERYVDFGPTLASEKLIADGIPVKRERLRQAMIAAGIWKPDLKRRRELHPPRERRPQRGELLQGDGSPHAWFEKRGPRCSLLLLIDDATTTIATGYFAPSETTEAYFEIMRRYIDLNIMLAHVEERVVSKDLIFKFKSKTYQLTSGSGERRMQHQHVLIRRINGEMIVQHRGSPVAFRELFSFAQPVVEAKSLNAQLDRSRLGPRLPDPKKQRTPPRIHPWRLLKATPPAVS